MMGKIAGKVRVTTSVLKKIRKQIQQVGIVPMTFYCKDVKYVGIYIASQLRMIAVSTDSSKLQIMDNLCFEPQEE